MCIRDRQLSVQTFCKGLMGASFNKAKPNRGVHEMIVLDTSATQLIAPTIGAGKLDNMTTSD